jgi:hypothetical protein
VHDVAAHGVGEVHIVSSVISVFTEIIDGGREAASGGMYLMREFFRFAHATLDPLPSPGVLIA